MIKHHSIHMHEIENCFFNKAQKGLKIFYLKFVMQMPQKKKSLFYIIKSFNAKKEQKLEGKKKELQNLERELLLTLVFFKKAFTISDIL